MSHYKLCPKSIFKFTYEVISLWIFDTSRKYPAYLERRNIILYLKRYFRRKLSLLILLPCKFNYTFDSPSESIKIKTSRRKSSLSFSLNEKCFSSLNIEKLSSSIVLWTVITFTSGGQDLRRGGGIICSNAMYRASRCSSLWSTLSAPGNLWRHRQMISIWSHFTSVYCS